MIIATRDNLHRYNSIRYFISKSVKITIAIPGIRSDSSIDNIAFPPGNEFYQARLSLATDIYERGREREIFHEKWPYFTCRLIRILVFSMFHGFSLIRRARMNFYFLFFFFSSSTSTFPSCVKLFEEGR